MNRLRIAAALAIAFAIAAFALDRLFPPDLTRYRAQSVELLPADGAPLNIATAPDGMWRLAATPEAVDPKFLKMLIATEDKRFAWHPGVDPLAVARAVWQLATHGHVVSGASTLTMQVARLLTPHRRDVPGKLLEMARALQLEARFSKREILSIYLTLAPYGGNIEGMRAASLIYFGKEPKALTDEQAALLVALPQSPTRFRPDRHYERAMAAMRKVLRRADPTSASGDLPPIRRLALASRARHLAERLRAQGLTGPIRTTLDGALQAAAEDMVRRERGWMDGKASVAVLVLRNRDRAVLAYVGGSDYLGPDGMVDMVRGVRSPGSALKPFIYGLAFDDGLILPDTLIDDAPIRVGDYAPRNFDHDFHGTVSVREALRQSYNLPAVEILSQVGPARFAAALRQAGAKLALPRGLEPSLPLALGGVGIDLEDLTALYAGLANQGKVGPPRLLASDPAAEGKPMMTALAAWQVGDVLRGTPLPDGVSMDRAHPIAYKTGTSYGFRDAWSVGYSTDFTVGVWVGRVEGSPRPGSFGRNTAAPVLFKLFDLLPPESEAPARPAGALAGADLSGSSARLSPLLRHYAPRSAVAMTADLAGPKIIFPPAGAVIEIDAAAPAPISLEANGGAPPYRWSINGAPMPPPPTGTTPAWTPDGVGFARISVSDRDNRSTAETVRLR